MLNKKMIKLAKLKAAILLITACSFLALISSCSTTKGQVSYPPDFNFSMRYGMGSGNAINTFDSTFTKDLVQKGFVTTKMALTPAEKDAIYRKMMDIDIFSYPDVFEPVTNNVPGGSFTPHGGIPSVSYSFRIQADGKTKEIYWNYIMDTRSEKSIKLLELIEQIRQIIISKPEYKALPESEGAYQ
jgi:hypothetical protein